LSLSDFIKLPGVKAKLKREFVKPAFRVKKELLAPVLTSDRPKIGIAFDYLVRFHANYLNPNAVSNKWVAEKSLEILNDLKNNNEVLITPSFRLTRVPKTVKMPIGFVKKCKVQKNRCYSEGKITIKNAKKTVNSYLKTGKMSNKLIISALDLAKLDVLSMAPKKPSKSDENDADDLRKLVSIINPDLFRADHTCVLNPNFGPKTTELMSAAGDIVIDNTLIDIKTYESLKVDREIFNQLIGYYTLYRIGGIRGMSPEKEITKLGVYFSRHGYLHTYKIEDLIDEKKYSNFIEWFKNKALEFNLP